MCKELEEAFSALKPNTVMQVHQELWKYLNDVRNELNNAQLTQNRPSIELLEVRLGYAQTAFSAINKIRDEQQALGLTGQAYTELN